MIIKIKINPPASEITRTWSLFPRVLNAHIAKALDLENELTIAAAIVKRLRYPSTEPTVPDGLRYITGQLARSLSHRRAVDEGDSVTSGIVSSVKYAAVHEYGFSGRVFVRPHSRKNSKKQKFFGKTRKIRGNDSFLGGYSRSMNLPERSYIRSTLGERVPEYKAAIAATVADTLKEMPRV